MEKFTYNIEAQTPSGAWFPIIKLAGLAYCRGYMDASREGPTPRLAWRLVRSDGRVIDEIPAIESAGVGMVAGWPTPEQYEHAAKMCLEKAKAIRDRIAGRG